MEGRNKAKKRTNVQGSDVRGKQSVASSDDREEGARGTEGNLGGVVLIFPKNGRGQQRGQRGGVKPEDG
ncbi:hypothetical protein WN48_02347 [Eufriesea mexicana]|nr:hypothetical protein WN48_02347 [Eufriesea mexicana]